MKQITLNIPDNQFSFFMQLVDSLKFVQIAEPSSIENSLSTSQKATWNNIKAGFEELKQIEQGKTKARPIEDLLKELES